MLRAGAGAISRSPSRRWPIRGGFTISRGAKHEAVVVVATISDGRHTGRGRMRALRALWRERRGRGQRHRGLRSSRRPEGLTRAEPRVLAPGRRRAQRARLRAMGPRGQARGRARRELAGLAPLQPVLTAFTLSLAAPEAMAARAREAARRIPCSSSSSAAMATPSGWPRCARPSRRRGSSPMPTRPGNRDDVESLLAAAAAAGVELVEQPLPAGDDDALAAHRPTRSGLRRRVGA